MPIIAARRYCQGQASDLPPGWLGGPRTPLPSGCFDWVGLSEPDEALMRQVARNYGLHPLAVEDALTSRQSPKVEIFGDQLFIVARTAAPGANDSIDYGQTALFLGRDFLVTVRQGNPRAHVVLRQELEQSPERLAEGPDFVAHALLDFIVDGYQPVLDELERLVLGLEDEALNSFPDQPTIRRIFTLRRQIRRFERVVGPMEEVCERLSTAELPAVDPNTRIWFRDVFDHVRRSLSYLRGLRDNLASLVETASLMEQHRQGEMTRQLAAWAAILAVPTAIAGIYGMNFQFMPELHWRYGYFGVVGAIALICTGLWWRFRKLGWL